MFFLALLNLILYQSLDFFFFFKYYYFILKLLQLNTTHQAKLKTPVSPFQSVWFHFRLIYTHQTTSCLIGGTHTYADTHLTVFFQTDTNVKMSVVKQCLAKV